MDAVFFAAPETLRAFLAEQHATATELVVGLWKKGAGRPTLSWAELVDELLCVGWIDGKALRIDDERWCIRCTPRRTGSHWSLRNVERMAVLLAEGRVLPAGESAFAARRPDRTGLASFEQTEAVLDDAQVAAFGDEAWAWFCAQAPSYQRAAKHWVVSAKRPETRERRLARLVEDSRARRRLEQFSRP